MFQETRETHKKRRAKHTHTHKKASTPRRGLDSVTLEDVARLAGVSAITVSRALNHPDKVAPPTLEEVTRAIELTGYVPNLLAGGLASQRSRLIAAIVPSIANLVYVDVIRSFSERLNSAGYQVILGESGYSETGEQTLISALLSRRPDGILLTGVNHAAACRRLLMASKIPLVETWDITPTPLDVVVGFSHQRIAEAVADYLAAKGYRRFGTVSADDHRAQLREKALVARLASHGIVDVSISTVANPTDLRRGREGLARLLDADFRHGAVTCSSDTLALGVLIEAQSRGIAVPDDIAIFGFGDQNLAADTYPALSTVRIDRPRMGRLAADALLARIAGEEVPEPSIDLGFEIVERETT